MDLKPVAERRKLGDRLDRFAKLCGDALERCLGGVDVLRRRHLRGADPGRRTREEANGPPLLERARIAEVCRHRCLDLRALADDPHHQEERHHRGDEVGVRHLPRPTVVAVLGVPGFLDDDDWLVLHINSVGSRQ